MSDRRKKAVLGPPAVGQIPHDEATELAVIGTLLVEPGKARERVQPLRSSLFHDIRLRDVFNAIRNAVEAGSVPDVVTVKRDPAMKGAAFSKILGDAPDKTHPPAFDQYVTTLVDLQSRRKLLEMAGHAVKVAGDTSTPLNGALQDFADCALHLGGNRSARLTIRKPSDILAMTFDDSDKIVGDRVLAKGQSLTILGPGGLGKSRFALQLAASCLAGLPFPGMATSGHGLRWLFMQAENSNRRLRADFDALQKWAGDRWHLIDDGLRIHTVENDEDGFLCLNQPSVQTAIADAIAEHKPDVVVFDPLKDFAIGDLNKDADMMDTCRTIAQLTRRGNPERASVTLHHAITGRAAAGRAVGYERASYGRNSKILQAWTRAQINVAPGSAGSNDVLVISCGKLSNGREFAPYAVRLNTETMLYELQPDFDFAAWEAETTGRTSSVELNSDRVAALCVGAMAKKDLIKAIMAETGVGKTKAYAAVEKADKSKRIHLHPVHKTYVAKR